MGESFEKILPPQGPERKEIGGVPIFNYPDTKAFNEFLNIIGPEGKWLKQYLNLSKEKICCIHFLLGGGPEKTAFFDLNENKVPPEYRGEKFAGNLCFYEDLFKKLVLENEDKELGIYMFLYVLYHEATHLYDANTEGKEGWYNFHEFFRVLEEQGGILSPILGGFANILMDNFVNHKLRGIKYIGSGKKDLTEPIKNVYAELWPLTPENKEKSLKAEDISEKIEKGILDLTEMKEIQGDVVKEVQYLITLQGIYGNFSLIEKGKVEKGKERKENSVIVSQEAYNFLMSDLGNVIKEYNQKVNNTLKELEQEENMKNLKNLLFKPYSFSMTLTEEEASRLNKDEYQKYGYKVEYDFSSDTQNLKFQFNLCVSDEEVEDFKFSLSYNLDKLSVVMGVNNKIDFLGGKIGKKNIEPFCLWNIIKIVNSISEEFNLIHYKTRYKFGHRWVLMTLLFNPLFTMLVFSNKNNLNPDKLLRNFSNTSFGDLINRYRESREGSQEKGSQEEDQRKEKSSKESQESKQDVESKEDQLEGLIDRRVIVLNDQGEPDYCGKIILVDKDKKMVGVKRDTSDKANKFMNQFREDYNRYRKGQRSQLDSTKLNLEGGYDEEWVPIDKIVVILNNKLGKSKDDSKNKKSSFKVWSPQQSKDSKSSTQKEGDELPKGEGQQEQQGQQEQKSPLEEVLRKLLEEKSSKVIKENKEKARHVINTKRKAETNKENERAIKKLEENKKIAEQVLGERPKSQKNIKELFNVLSLLDEFLDKNSKKIEDMVKLLYDLFITQSSQKVEVIKSRGTPEEGHPIGFDMRGVSSHLPNLLAGQKDMPIYRTLRREKQKSKLPLKIRLILALDNSSDLVGHIGYTFLAIM